MPGASYEHKNLWLLTPTLGVMIYILLYVIATFVYPGGSQADKNSTGFSWVHNYWCNLLNDYAINGRQNAAKPIALTGMFILCSSLSFFWFFIPRYIGTGWRNKSIIQISGTLAMGVAALLFTKLNHDLITNIASFLGIIAAIGIIISLYQPKWYGSFVFGLLNVLFVVLNNYFYYNPDMIIYLPVVQKISFLSFLIWICNINIRVYVAEHQSRARKICDSNVRMSTGK